MQHMGCMFSMRQVTASAHLNHATSLSSAKLSHLVESVLHHVRAAHVDVQVGHCCGVDALKQSLGAREWQ